MPTPSRAIGYFRVSTTGQSGEHHVSLDTQRDHFASYCQSQGLVAVRTFTDVATGRKDNRKEYQFMLRFLQDKTADVVVVQYLDRFGRNPKEILRRIWALQEVGVEVQATDEDIKEELILLVRAGLAGAESKKTSARIKANIGKAVAKGVHVGRPPYGFDGIRTISADGRARISQFVVNEVEAEAVKRMYKLAAEENHGFRYIAEQLNSEGYRTKASNIFTSHTVRKILSDQAIVGNLVYGKRQSPDYPAEALIVIPGFFPPIISGKQWESLQASLAIRRGIYSHGRIFTSGYLLSGLARCGYCGGSIVGKLSSQRPWMHRRYFCHRALTSRLMCSHRNSHRAAALEKEVLARLGRFADKKRTLELLAGMGKPTDNRMQEMSRIAREIKACEAEFALHLRLLKEKHITEAQFSLANEPVKQRYEALLKRSQEMERAVGQQKTIKSWHQNLAHLLATFSHGFAGLSLVQQKAKLISIIKEIKVFEDGRIEVVIRDSPLAVP